jgi:pyruvate formate lyase activating enzyme
VPREKTAAVATLERALQQRTREGVLYEKLDGGRVRCFACGHRCVVLEGLDGICRVRFNRGGTLFVPHGYVAGLQVDPIEKKPFFHAFPGAVALSFGMLGCDYHCGYCQNWITSQALRDSAALAPARDTTPDEIVALARRHGVPVMVSTYNEPLITSEWAVEVFARAKDAGITCGYVSNGNGTPEVLDYIRPYVDLYKVDLKGFRDASYRELGGTLANVVRTIESLKAMGFWLEIVTLLIPGFNDSPEELRDLTRFLASVSPDVPWHVTAFHADYRMLDRENTAARELVRAAEIGKEAGLRYVYAGNLPGRVGDLENTRCHACGEMLVERHGYHVLQYRIESDGTCPGCRTRIPGFWREGWTVPENDGGLPGRAPRSIR